MKLGTLHLKNNLILAPMQNVTTGPYRRFCRHFSDIGLVYVPMLYIKRIVKNPESIERELYKIEEESPIGIQLIGSEPIDFIEAIEYLESYKFNILDINAGCPSRRALKNNEGGYLVKDLKRLETILDVSLKYCSKPVSLKTRLGFEKRNKINELAALINNSDIEFVSVHARTVKSRFDDTTLDLNALKDLKNLITIPLVGNGNINDPQFAKYFFEYTNVDALMIGRESMGNPKIFSQISNYLTKGELNRFNNNLETMIHYLEIYEQIIDEFSEGLKLVSLEDYKLVELQRNAIWLTKNLKDSTDIRSELSKTKTLIQLKTFLDNVKKKRFQAKPQYGKT
jgi:tRNA-dihydrouridine synthase B